MLLCMFVGTAWAEGYYLLSEKVTELATGKYVIMAKSDKGNGPCYYGSDIAEKPYRYDLEVEDVKAGKILASKYVWNVEVLDGGKITVKWADDETKFFVKDEARNMNFSGTEMAELIFEEKTINDAKFFALKLDVEAVGYIHANAPGGNPCLSYWDAYGDDGSCVKFQFYPVEATDEVPVEPTRITALDEVNKEKAYVIYSKEAAFTVNDDKTALKPTGKNVEWDKENTNNHFTFVNLGGDYFLYSVAAQKFMKIDATLGENHFEDPIEFVKCTGASYAGRVRMRFKKDTSKNIDFNGQRTTFDICGWAYEDEGTAFYVEEIADFDFSTLEPSLVAFTKTEYASWETEYREKYVGEKLGQYVVDEEALAAAEAELNAAETLEEASAAVIKCKEAFILNEPVLNTYYRIKNTKHSTYTAFDGYTLNMKNVAEDANDPTQLWQYVKEGDKLYMKNVYTALYPQSIPSGADKTAALGVGKDNAFTYALYAPATDEVDAQWNIFFGGKQVNIEPSGNVNYWFQDGAHHNLYEVEITDDALVEMCVNWYEKNPYEYVAPEVTAADFQKIDIDPNATVVISPSEFAAPAEINAAIDKLAELDNTMKTPAVEDIDDIHALFAAIAGYTGAVNALNEYKSAVTSHGELLSIAYTPKAEWGTIILPINWAKPEGWTRYSCSAIEGNVLTLNEYAEGSTNNNPMIIKVEEEKVGITYQLIGYSNGAGTENVTKGLLTGVLEDDTQVPTASYILADYNDVVAFYPVAEGANYAASKYKCYLTLPAAEARYSALYFEGGETAIESIEGTEAENAVVYDLSGRRVQKAQKGLYIVNGKKVVK